MSEKSTEFKKGVTLKVITRKRTVKFLSFVLALLVATSIFPLTVSAAGYDRGKALAYAKNNWNKGSGESCAKFVSACVTAGGAPVSEAYVGDLYRSLSGKYGTSYKLTLTGGGSGKISAAANSGKVEAGDPIIYYCNACKTYAHAVLSNGTSSNGYVQVYAQNNAHDGYFEMATWEHGCGNSNSWIVYSIHMNAGSAETNNAAKNEDEGWYRPVDKKYWVITDYYGKRNQQTATSSVWHWGIDIGGAGINGTPIRATRSGKVIRAGENTGAWGYHVQILHDNGYSSFYMHMKSKACVSVGQTVKQGQVIGYVGSTGDSTGPHLDFRVLVGTNPNWKNTQYGRGGTVDPLKFTYKDTLKIIAPTDAPKATVSKTTVAQGDSVRLSWNAVSGATGYEVVLRNVSKNADVETRTTSSTSIDITLKEVAEYKISVRATNSVGKGPFGVCGGIFTKAPLTVTFVDYDGKLLEAKSVKYGYAAAAPTEVPQRKGHTFTGWDKSFLNVTENMTVKAEYTKNKYTVTFYYGDDEISRQTVLYGESAKEPEYSIKPGYKFLSWSDSFDSIEEDKRIDLVDVWYNSNMKIYVDSAKMTATRDDDGNGYEVLVPITNNKNEITTGRIVVALKTAEGKLVETTESAAFSLKAGASKTLEIFIPSTKAASVVDVIAVEKFSSAIPISDSVNKTIDQQHAWSDWSTNTPPSNAFDTETSIQYRYKDKIYIDSGYSAVDGYTLAEKKQVESWTGGWSDTPVSATDKVVGNYFYDYSSESIQAYQYKSYATDSKKWYHSNANGNYYGERTKNLLLVWSSGLGTSYDEDGYEFPKTFGVNQSFGGNIGKIYYITYKGSPVSSFASTARYTPMYDMNGKRNGTKGALYRQTYKKYQYRHWKWGDFGDWSATPVSETNDRQVESRQIYRYKTNELTGIEDNTGVLRKYSGKLSAALAGKEASIFVYKIDEASDYTNEFVGFTKIADDGSYSFEFKLREEPTVKTGDFTVVLGIEGSNGVITLEPILAPVKTYTVTFMDTDGNIISRQTVKDGENATVPESVPEKEGYTFTGWSSTATNIKNDVTIYAKYEVNKYSVVFVDWVKQTVEMKTFDYGSELSGPLLSNTDEYVAIGWDKILQGTKTVTESLVVTAQYKRKEFTVNFYDYDGNILKSETVEYGEEVAAPDSPEKEKYVFEGWNNYSYGSVKENLDIKPLYHFSETVAAPTANKISKTYNTAQEVALKCDTVGAEIYYTTDGSDPAIFGRKYTGALNVEKSCVITFYAKKALCNDSEKVSVCYAINTENMMSDYLTFEELPDEVKANAESYSLTSENGYRYKDIKTVTTKSEAAALEASGWTLSDTKQSAWSDWERTLPDISDYEATVEQREADPVLVPLYQYKHWKYFDENSGEYVCASEEIAGVDGYWETMTSQKKLNVSTFINSKPAYRYDNALWFNQTIIEDYISAGYDVYRYSYSVKTYYKWTEWTDKHASVETREIQNEIVYKYLMPDRAVVCVDYSDSKSDSKNEYFLIKLGDSFALDESKFVIDGAIFKGVYTDKEHTVKWDGSKVTGDLTLYPYWEAETFKVRFLDYDNSVLSEQTVEYLNSAKIPENPERAGYVFTGWSNSPESIVGDTDFVAQYVAESEYVRVKLSRSRLSLMTGSSAKISVAITPESAIESEVVWYSSNPEIAEVDSLGNITAVHSGTAVITVISLETYETDNCVITVLGSLDTEILPVSKSAVKVDPAAKYLLGVKAGKNSINNINDELQNPGLIYTDIFGKAFDSDKDGTLPMGTGNKIKLMDGDYLVDEVQIVVTGDVNGDGATDVLDALNVEMVCNNHNTLDGVFFKAGDILTDDGVIDVNDYSAIINEALA